MKANHVLFLAFLICVIPSLAQLNKGDSLFSIAKYKEAIHFYKNAEAELSQEALQSNRLAYCYHQTKNYQLAMEYYQKALKLNPKPALKSVIQARMARVYAVQKNNATSLQYLEDAIKNGYQNLGELTNERDFNSIRSNTRFKTLKDSIYKIQCPCVSDIRKNEFDFWLGEWTVVTTQGHFAAGKSKIEKAADNCLVLENWTSVNGTSGKSMNYIEPASNKWEQTWSGSGGEIMRFTNGVYDGTQMQFEFTRTTNGKKQIGKFHFYNISKTEVRQMEEVSEDGGTTWLINYDLTYMRNK
jgi:tetratricopeptide (TPR) repeat protein